MASIKISELAEISQLSSGSLFVVVHNSANKNMKFSSLSNQLYGLISGGLSTGVLLNGFEEISNDVESIQGEVASLTAGLASKKATDDDYGFVKLSSDFEDASTRIYGLNVDSEGHAYVHVPWSADGTGSVSAATDSELGGIKTWDGEHRLTADGSTCYGVRLSTADSNANPLAEGDSNKYRAYVKIPDLCSVLELPAIVSRLADLSVNYMSSDQGIPLLNEARIIKLESILDSSDGAVGLAEAVSATALYSKTESEDTTEYNLTGGALYQVKEDLSILGDF